MATEKVETESTKKWHTIYPIYLNVKKTMAEGDRTAGDGKKTPEQLTFFLDQHATTMPRVMLRYAIEQMSKEKRDHYLGQ